MSPASQAVPKAHLSGNPRATSPGPSPAKADQRAVAAATLPAGTAEDLVSHIGCYGRLGVETGGFLLAAAVDPAAVTMVALAGAKGIVRGPDRFVVSGLAVDILSEWAEQDDLRIVAGVHSHAGAARLSLIDQESGFRVEGFTSIVVPRFAAPPTDPSHWGWYRFTLGSWRDRMPGTTRPDPGVTVIFDEDGVR
jgi:hypothetical protein